MSDVEVSATGPVLGIVSDTHGLLRAEALEALRGVEHIIHAGDIGADDIVPRLAAIAPVTAIRGNIDTADWADAFPAVAHLNWRVHRILVIHDRNDLVEPKDCTIVVSGHSHRASIERRDGLLFLNPGSAGPRRFKLPVTLATLRVDGPALLPTIHTLL